MLHTKHRSAESCILCRVRTMRRCVITLPRPGRTKGDTFIQRSIKLWSSRGEANLTDPVNGLYVLSPLSSNPCFTVLPIFSLQHGMAPSQYGKNIYIALTYIRHVPDIYCFLLLRENELCENLEIFSLHARHLPSYYLTYLHFPYWIQ